MNRDSTPKEHVNDFVTSLEKLAKEGHEDRAALAKLRTGLGVKPGTAMAQHRYVSPFLPEEKLASEGANRWFFVIGALFAWHPTRSRRDVSLGEALRRLKKKQGASESIEKRFAALLASDEQELDVHLRQIVGLLRANDIPVDWRTLLSDLTLTGWNHSERKVQSQWARKYYYDPRATSELNDEAKNDEPNTES